MYVWHHWQLGRLYVTSSTYTSQQLAQLYCCWQIDAFRNTGIFVSFNILFLYLSFCQNKCFIWTLQFSCKLLNFPNGNPLDNRGYLMLLNRKEDIHSWQWRKLSQSKMEPERTPTVLELKINCRGQCGTERCGVGGERSLGYKQLGQMVAQTGWISQTVFKQVWRKGPRPSTCCTAQ